ncbi:hypothetical protein [Sphingomonas sp. CFBP 13706]|uniref:hypothetical protein n=1 Tax=Sphingomonas sp. CFBP 13706 TaxID=2775314 RepID=UPI001784827F|nr:hypothetical protein [Sphingomonas sp. CFBP 13706]MBD8736802.1 hypothetical protein [Sphingomonas sp. CFBP 13706]
MVNWMSEPAQKFMVETLLFLGGLPWLIWRWLRSGRPSITPLPIINDGNGGKIVPLIATFSGLRGLPWIGFASNNLNPRLVIQSDGITYRIAMLRFRGWGDIIQVDVQSVGATVNLSFAFRDSLFTFDANVGSTMLAAQTLALLPDHIALTDRAKLLLMGGG